MSVQHLSEIELVHGDGEKGSKLLWRESLAVGTRCIYAVKVDGWDVSAMGSSRRTPIGTLVQPTLSLLPESC